MVRTDERNEERKPTIASFRVTVETAAQGVILGARKITANVILRRPLALASGRLEGWK